MVALYFILWWEHLQQPRETTINKSAAVWDGAEMKRALPFIIIAIVGLMAIFLMFSAGGVWLFSKRSQPAMPASGPSPQPGSEPPGAVPSHVRGNPNAPVTVEEFADFQCPSCGAYYPELKKIESEYGERLRVIFRENPLYPKHQYSVIAAQAAEAAGLQSEAQFWAMHDKLYENQNTWSEAKDVTPIFVDYARQIGLNVDRFMRDINGEAVAQRIFQDGKRAHSLGIESTPTFVVNGKEATGDSWKPEGLRQMINEALRAAGQ
ncbi:MAG TPA: thioredoxin domain-containing protein [Pyrinomonadaceae bacterium]|jgi:protein-disulfide isomerase